LIFVNCLNILCNTSFKKHLPEDGHDRWPKRVGSYAVYNTINVQICMSTHLFLISSSPCFTSWWRKNHVGCDCCLISYDMATLFTTKGFHDQSHYLGRPKKSTIYKIFALLPCYASSWTDWSLKMGEISCPEKSLRNNHTTLRNTPEERRHHTAAVAWNHVIQDKSQDTRYPQARFKTGIFRT